MVLGKTAHYMYKNNDKDWTETVSFKVKGRSQSTYADSQQRATVLARKSVKKSNLKQTQLPLLPDHMMYYVETLQDCP